MPSAVQSTPIYIHIHKHIYTYPDLGPFCQYVFFRFVVKFLLCIRSSAVVKLPHASFEPKILFIFAKHFLANRLYIRSNDSMIQLAWKIVSSKFYSEIKIILMFVLDFEFRFRLLSYHNSANFYLCKVEKKNGISFMWTNAWVYLTERIVNMQKAMLIKFALAFHYIHRLKLRSNTESKLRTIWKCSKPGINSNEQKKNPTHFDHVIRYNKSELITTYQGNNLFWKAICLFFLIRTTQNAHVITL